MALKLKHKLAHKVALGFVNDIPIFCERSLPPELGNGTVVRADYNRYELMYRGRLVFISTSNRLGEAATVARRKMINFLAYGPRADKSIRQCPTCKVYFSTDTKRVYCSYSCKYETQKNKAKS